MRLETHYGKADVSTYRTYGTPLRGVRRIPESAFDGRPNILMAASIDVQVMGDAFIDAYTVGDNSNVVATDTMKNFIHRESLAFSGSTLEGWLLFLGTRFLDTYPQMDRLRVSGEELRFDAQWVPQDGGFGPSEVLYHRRHDDRSVSMRAIILPTASNRGVLPRGRYDSRVSGSTCRTSSPSTRISNGS